MLGRHHLLLSVATVGLVAAPLFVLAPTIALVALAGTAIGSLIPDADAEDAAIFHTEVRGLNGSTGKTLDLLAPVFPVFGYATKYLIYKPSVVLYDTYVFEEQDVVERHRGLLHSVLGLGTATVLTGIYLIPVLLFLGLFSILHLGVFLLAYLVGGVLHLAEDSCTKTGIQWHYPVRDWKVEGRLTTTARRRDTIYQDVFAVVLGGCAVGLFLLAGTYSVAPAPVLLLVGGVLAVALWLGFARLVAKCRIVRAG